ncbi:MAG: TIGR00266 family protein [Intestinibaculum porci]|uniref:TIGR00266 family protein n=1 Tax=Intestinibaculum porci TaxID=2487118 RepID=UPI002409DC13|nr:TIGR00266 family protein [Intestinibaculum porci]MDD6423539.1 TIGR00266 family protein [Intestinibaculum porci]
MRFTINGDADCPLAHISLDKGETIKIERGAMAYMANVEIVGKMNSKKKGLGGMLGAIGRSLTSGESMFITQAQGTANGGYIGVAPAIPGAIAKLEVGAKQYRLNTGAFLASDDNVNYVMKRQDLGKAFFGGTGGLFVMETEGSGDILVNAFGALVELEVTPDTPLTIDNEHVVAWDADLDYNIEIASGTFGFTTGEGLVNTFHGQGKVLIQTRNLHSLADALSPFLPDKSSNS